MPDIEIAIIGGGLGGCFASMKWTSQLLLNDDPILDHYMVLFTINHSMELRQATIGQSLTGLLRHTWDIALFGYATRLDNATLQLIRADPEVVFVGQDYYLDFPYYEDAFFWWLSTKGIHLPTLDPGIGQRHNPQIGLARCMLT